MTSPPLRWHAPRIGPAISIVLLICQSGLYFSDAKTPSRSSSAGNSFASKFDTKLDWDSVLSNGDDNGSDSDYWENEEYQAISSEISNKDFDFEDNSAYKDLQPTGDELKFEMPSLKSVLEEEEFTAYDTTSSNKDALYDAYNELHNLAQVSWVAVGSSVFQFPCLLTLSPCSHFVGIRQAFRRSRRSRGRSPVVWKIRAH